MSRFALPLLILSCLLLSACSGKQTTSAGPQGFTEQNVSSGRNFTLAQITKAMDSRKLPNLISIPREQQAGRRAGGDPVEIASASIKPVSGSENVSVGLYLSASDAADAYKQVKLRVHKLQRDLRAEFRVSLACNAIVTYDPGTDLRDLQLQTRAEELGKALAISCKDPKAHPLT
jgi:hypothetical protein